MELNKIYIGDCLEVLKTFPDKSINMCVTSPPYFNLRDYGTEGEVGSEENVEEYINKLVEIFSEVYRVLDDEGACWVNIDDVYAKKNIDGVKRQSLMCIPDKFKIKMVESGWICRNEIIWKKPNAMPSSAKNRFNNDYEKFYFFTKTNYYYFDTQYEPLQSKIPTSKKKSSKEDTKYQNSEQEASVRQGMNKTRGENIVALRKNLPTQEEFVEFLRNRTDINSLADNSEIKRSTIEHWFRRDKTGFAYPKVEDWNSIKHLVDDWSEEFQRIDEQLNDITYETDDILKNVTDKRIKRSVWEINTKPFKGCHYAPYPEDLVLTPILACTKPDGIVLDPFIGSGTTGVVSKRNGRNYIGIELNTEYGKVAEKRIQDVVL